MRFTGAVIVGGIAFSSPIADADVVSHWRLDELTGPVAADSVGSVNGIALGNATFVPNGGIIGGAICLDQATGDMVDFGTAYPIDQNENVSISLWLQTLATANDTIPLGRHLTGSPNGYLMIVNQTSCYGSPNTASAFFNSGCGSEATSTTAVNDGAWHHIVMSRSSNGVLRIFVDGVLEDSSTGPVVQDFGASLLLGGVTVGTTPTALYTGMIDDVQVYDHAASEAQVQSLFEHPGQSLPPCVADLAGDGVVNVADLLTLLGAWGTPEGDITNDGTTSVSDLLLLLSEWGSCPLIE